MPKIINYPRFKNIGKTKEGLLVYSYSELKRSIEDCNFSGSSAAFLHNNATVGNKFEYSLKVFWMSKEAKNAYKRQKLAANAGLAPPVGKMFVVVDKKLDIRYWGYQTCRAYIPQCISNFKRIKSTMRVELKKIEAPATDLPAAYTTPKKCCLGGDLHEDNIGIWKDKHVCIDFGHHSLIQKNGRRLRTNTSHKWDWRKKLYVS